MHATTKRQTLAWTTLFVVTASAIMSGGCASVYHMTHYNWLSIHVKDLHYRNYYHSAHTGRIIAKEHHQSCVSEPACFGYEATCWRPWPADCLGCPTGAPLPADHVIATPVAEPSVVTPAETVEPADVPVDDAFDQGDFIPQEDIQRDDSVPLPGLQDSSAWDPSEIDAPEPSQKVEVSPLDAMTTETPLIEEEPILPTNDSLALEPRIARREIEQKMVLVDEFEQPLAPSLDAPKPMVEVAEVEGVSQLVAEELIAPEQPAIVETTAQTLQVVSEMTTGETELPTPVSAPQSIQHVIESVPSFKIVAVMPTEKKSAGQSELKLANVEESVIASSPVISLGGSDKPQGNATIRFVSEEERGTVRVGTAIKVREGKTSLRFR